MLGSGTGLMGRSKSRMATGRVAQMSNAVRGDDATRWKRFFSGTSAFAHNAGKVRTASAENATRSHSTASATGVMKRVASKMERCTNSRNFIQRYSGVLGEH